MASVNSLVTQETLLRTIRAPLPLGQKRKEIIQGLDRREHETLFSTHISSKDTLLTEEAVDGITTNLRVRQLSNPPPRLPMANYRSVEYFEISCPVDPKWAFSMLASLPSVTFVRFGSSTFEKIAFLNEAELRSEMGPCWKLRELHIKTDPARLSKLSDFNSILVQLGSILDYARLYCPYLERAELTLPLQMKNKLEEFLEGMPKLRANGMKKEMFKDDIVYFTTNNAKAQPQYPPPAPIPIVQQQQHLPPPTTTTTPSPCAQQRPTNEITMTTTTVLASPPLPPPVEVDSQMTSNSSAATAKVMTRVKSPSQSPVLASSTDTPTTTTTATTRTMVSDPRIRARHRHQGQQRGLRQQQQQQQQMTWSAPTASGQPQPRKRRFCSLESNQSTGSSEKYDPFEEAMYEPTDDYYGNGNVDETSEGGSSGGAVVGQISDDYEDYDDEDRPLIIDESATATKTTATRIDLSPTPVPPPKPAATAPPPPLHTNNNMYSLPNAKLGFQPPLPRTPSPQSQPPPPPPPSTQLLQELEQGKIPKLEPLWYDKAKNILNFVGEKANGNGNPGNGGRGGGNVSMTTTASHLIPAGLILNGPPENRGKEEGQRPPYAKKSKSATAAAAAVTDKIVEGGGNGNGDKDNVKLLNDEEFQNLYTRPARKNNKEKTTADSKKPRYYRRF